MANCTIGYIATVQVRGSKEELSAYTNYGFGGRIYAGPSLHTLEFTVYSAAELSMLTSFLKHRGCKYTKSEIGGNTEDEVNYEKYHLPEMLMGEKNDYIVPNIIKNITTSIDQQKKMEWKHIVAYKKTHAYPIYDDMLFLYASMVIADENHADHDKILLKMFGYDGVNMEIHRLRSNLLRSRLELPPSAELIDLSQNSLKKVRKIIECATKR